MNPTPDKEVIEIAKKYKCDVRRVDAAKSYHSNGPSGVVITYAFTGHATQNGVRVCHDDGTGETLEEVF
jgi:hypothetical protein